MQCSPGKYLRDCCSQSRWQCCSQTDWEARASPAGGRGLLGASYWGHQEAVQTDNIIRLPHSDIHFFIELNIKNVSQKQVSRFKEWKPFVFISICWVDGHTDSSTLPQNVLKHLIVQAYQFRPGEWQSDRGSPPATTNQLTARLLHHHIKKQHRLSKHSCTSKPHHAKSDPGSRVRLGGDMVPTCNIKDASLGGGGSAPHYRPLWECTPTMHITLPLS